jgi:hypothetical protein
MAVVVPGTPHAGTNRYEIRGRTGVLRSGSRVVTELVGWRAESFPDGTLRVHPYHHEPDPYWWEHHDGSWLVLDLDFGRDGLRGPATIVASEPLVIDMTQEAD